LLLAGLVCADNLFELLALANSLPVVELPTFLGQLETIRVTAMARLASPTVAQTEDCLLEVPEASARLGVSPDYLYHHHSKFPFTRRVGRKLLFSARGIEQHIRRGK
jgi:hypothetical protein